MNGHGATTMCTMLLWPVQVELKGVSLENKLIKIFKNIKGKRTSADCWVQYKFILRPNLGKINSRVPFAHTPPLEKSLVAILFTTSEFTANWFNVLVVRPHDHMKHVGDLMPVWHFIKWMSNE